MVAPSFRPNESYDCEKGDFFGVKTRIYRMEHSISLGLHFQEHS